MNLQIDDGVFGPCDGFVGGQIAGRLLFGVQFDLVLRGGGGRVGGGVGGRLFARRQLLVAVGVHLCYNGGFLLHHLRHCHFWLEIGGV